MTHQELVKLMRLISRWRLTQELTHAQRNGLERFQIDVANLLLDKFEDDESPIPF
jgi:hypothetical protein